MFEFQLIFKEIVINTNEYKDELELRDKILRIPLGLSIVNDDLESEVNDAHLGCFEKEKLIGVVMLSKIDDTNVRVRQVAIDQEYQGHGIGAKIMSFAEDKAKELGYKQITLHSRKSAELFYRKLGYLSIGEAFVEVSIEHITMYKALG